ncbi:hypothetical protein Fot_21359 [Forsythia ovata]|uniref:Uncharacterized protein n=1 Tax=Forsythia ovata TaxID=205694 RepID=A0ABD1UVQ4_9LAMI
MPVVNGIVKDTRAENDGKMAGFGNLTMHNVNWVVELDLHFEHRMVRWSLTLKVYYTLLAMLSRCLEIATTASGGKRKKSGDLDKALTDSHSNLAYLLSSKASSRSIHEIRFHPDESRKDHEAITLGIALAQSAKKVHDELHEFRKAEIEAMEQA